MGDNIKKITFKEKFFMSIKNKMKKIGTAALSVALAITSFAACGGNNGGGGNNGSKNVTEIEFVNFIGCTGDVWIKNAAERFSALKAEESYENNKKGVRINVSNVKDIPYNTLNSEGYDIYVGESKADIYGMASSNLIMDLTDVVSGIESKIKPDARKRIKGADGKYYGLPFYEWYTGVSYDQDFFKDYNLYIASPEVTGREYSSKFGKIKFVASADDRKSCGPDGVYETSDDGLPSSLQEYLILCSAIKEEGGRAPFTIAGASLDYAYFLVDALWASLAGVDQIKTIYSINTNGQKIVEVVTGYTDEDLFYTGSGIKRPTTEMIAIDESNGYKIYDMASRYYALAALEVIYKEGWFSEYEFKRDTLTNLVAQSNFINKGTSGMIYDASFWCSESDRNGYFETYKKTHPDKPERNVSYMSMPTTLETTVTEGNGKKQALLDVGSAQMFVAKKVENNAGKKRAVIEFLQFLYSDSELAAFTELTGLNVPIEYNYDESKLNDYYKKLAKIREESEIVYFASESNVVLKNLASFNLGFWGAINKPVIDNVEVSKGYIVAMRDHNANAKTIFDLTKKTSSAWDKLKK